MIGRVETLLRRLRRSISRSEWLARLLRLPASTGAGTRPGLVMIQIDGLSQREFERAIERGELPFLKRLIKREQYQVHPHYSGLPASTPAVQGELFYGIKGVVPAFSFQDPESRQIVRMYEPKTAACVERFLADSGNEPLLAHGSAYADNFTGGADESHFCPSSLGWGPALRAANPIALGLFLLSNAYSFLRIGVLLLIELILAVVDFVRGIDLGHSFVKEIAFIPTRVAICILLRELTVIGTKIDCARGVPIVHLNFLGYDEQAHRRGPRSLFAHWTLKGIDDAIARIWRSANRSTRRDYDVWIYSDHGQESTRPYDRWQGRSIHDAVYAAFEQLDEKIEGAGQRKPESVQTRRVSFLGGRRFQRLFSLIGVGSDEPDSKRIAVAALGPLAFVYPPRALNRKESDFVARELAVHAKIPVVITRDGSDNLRAWTEAGNFALPQQHAELFGEDHPFLEETQHDLMNLCQHPAAGDFVLMGWRKGVTPLTFAIENGSHAGISPQETNAFALLPVDAPLAERKNDYLRPVDLRKAALHLLGRGEPESIVRPQRPATTTINSLRIMTYNVHSCIGMDGKLAPERIARVIARANPDVVALQELDVGRARTEGIDQAHRIARYLEMDFHFHPAMHIEEERYGDAILTHLPMRLIKADALPGLSDLPRLERRGALWVAIDVGGQEVQIINTHLGLFARERMEQVNALLGTDWLANEQCRGPVILCGDFNAVPSSPASRRLCNDLNDAQMKAEHHRPKSTFFGRFPTARIDHVFVNSEVEVGNITVSDSELARVASDHLPLVVDVLV
jgi:endonuclease/exonuclease/phosphatase family metal-dependent hydrolase